VRIADLLEALTRAAGRGSLLVVGAVARNAWAPPRATSDLDLAVAASSKAVSAVEAALAALGYSCARRQQVDVEDDLPDVLVFRGSDPRLRQVDLLVAKTEFEREALSRGVEVELGGVLAPVATPEDLMVYKLIADRPRDREDLRAVFRTQSRAGRTFDWSYVEKWARYWELAERLAVLRAELGA
jgi:hypothetical protein